LFKITIDKNSSSLKVIRSKFHSLVLATLTLHSVYQLIYLNLTYFSKDSEIYYFALSPLLIFFRILAKYFLKKILLAI